MDVVRLVVEAQRRRASGPNAQLGLHDVDREVERVVVPGRVGDGGKVVRARIGLFAAAILILELEPERLARIKTVERSVERWGRGHPQRGAHDGRRLFELEEGCERRLRCARPRQPNPHGAHRRGFANRLEHRHEACTSARGADDVEGLPLLVARPPRPLRPHQLAVEREKRLQDPRPGRELEHQRRGALTHELLHSRHELVRELPRGPPPPSPPRSPRPPTRHAPASSPAPASSRDRPPPPPPPGAHAPPRARSAPPSRAPSKTPPSPSPRPAAGPSACDAPLNALDRSSSQPWPASPAARAPPAASPNTVWF